MKQQLSIAFALGLFTFIDISSAQTTPADAERFSKQLTFDAVETFNTARTKLEARASAAEYLMGYLQEKALQTQVSREMEKVMPNIEKALKATPRDCALVSVTVDSASNGTAKQYNLRSVQFEGMGDTAVQVLAPKIFSSEKFGSYNKNAADGFKYDDAMSHMICFGVSNGQVKATEVFMPTLRSGVTAAVQKLRKADEEIKKAEDARRAEEARRRAEAERKERMAERPEPEDPAPDIEGTWQWLPKDQKVTIYSDGTCTSSYKVSGTWALLNARSRTYRIQWKNGFVDTLTLSANGDALTGSNQNAKHPEPFTRIE